MVTGFVTDWRKGRLREVTEVGVGGSHPVPADLHSNRDSGESFWTSEAEGTNHDSGSALGFLKQVIQEDGVFRHAAGHHSSM